jgi:hypothetical protein
MGGNHFSSTTISSRELQLIEQVDVRIADVDTEETQHLTIVIDELATSPATKSACKLSIQDNDLIVTIIPGELSRLKNALRRILDIVNPDRIDIEPFDGY